MDNFLSQAVIAAIPSCIGPVLKNIAYPFKVSDNVKALDVATGKLAAAQTDVMNRVHNDELQGFTQTNQVEEWLGRVETIRGEVAEIIKRHQERSRCLGKQFLNFWSNYSISKVATKKLTEVQELCEEGGKFAEVAIQLPPTVPVLPIGSEVVVPQEEANLQEILRYINSDQYDIIGIWGMGGVGKTRLLHLVHNLYKGSSAFDVVAKVTASRECSVEKIQEELCEKCGFGRKTSVESQARIISDNLTNRNFLILLDDVWGHIDLEGVGIPLGLGNQFKKKVVITTRSLGVCGLMRVKKSIMVDRLDHEHALRLFNENVGDETINSHPQIPSLAVKVVRELGGLPLALITIGQSMSDKRSPNEWNYAIDRLEKSGLNEIDEEKIIFNKLKLSYDSLNTKKLKDCFLVCSLWPEDCLIGKIELIECWLGLGLLDLDIFDARNIYNPGYDVIRKLLSACLLQEEGSACVKVHDVIRDMALWIAHDEGKEKDKWVVLNGDESVLNHENIVWPRVERASLHFRSRKSLIFLAENISHANGLQFLRVDMDTFPIFSISRSYFFTIEQFVTNLRSFHDLVFLDLRFCAVKDIPRSISNFVNLKYLDLSSNLIRSVPEELKHVTNLRYLSLKNNPFYSFPVGVLAELSELQILNLLFSTFSTDGGKYLTLIKELGCLRKLRSLSITLRHPTHFRNFLNLPKLPVRDLILDYENETDILEIPSSFIENGKVQDNLNMLELAVRSVGKIVIGSESDYQSQLGNLEFVSFRNMKMLEMIQWPRNISPEDLLPTLSKLYFSDCDRLKDLSWTLYLPCLRTLEINSCNNIVQLIEHIGGSSSATKPTFPSLIKLSLKCLSKMENICDQSITFRFLEEIHIIQCPMLKKLPFQPNTVPSKLKLIRTERKCWEQLEWEDNGLKQILDQLVKVSLI